MVIVADPRQRVDNSDIAVETEAPDALVPDAEPGVLSVADDLPASGVSFGALVLSPLRLPDELTF